MKAKDLKNSILQMAVEGKLVPQDPSDEPASVLLERIREEKHELIAEGKAKFPKGGESIIYIASDGSPYEKRVDAKGRVLSDECIAGEMPFEELPEGWCWTRLENLCSVITDGDHQAPPQQADGVPFLVISDVSSGELDFSNTRHVSIDYFKSLDDSRKPCRGDLLLTVTGSFGIPVPVDTEESFCFQRHIALLRPLSCRKFMANILLAPSTYEYFKAKATGTAQKTVSLSCLRSTLLALPPENEQLRIVGKLAQLMPLVEEYGRFEDAREELDTALPGRLRKSVLQMAVQGKLVPQDPGDEPASVLLERIREQRRQLVAEKKMKATKGDESVIFTGSDGRRYEKCIDTKGRESEPVCIEDEIPFGIPDSWEWARLGSLCDFGKCRNIEYESVAVGTWNLDLEDIEKESGTILRKKRKTASESGSTKHIFSAGMVLYSKLRPYLNKVVAADEGGVCSSEILPLDFGQLNSEYAQLALMEPGFVEYAKECSYGVKMPRLGTEDGKQWLVAIPPLPEQHRIVAAFKTFTMNAF